MPREDLIVLGRKIGTHEGYDIIDTEIFSFYKFEPIPALHRFLPSCDLAVNYAAGHFSCYDGDEITETGIDMIEILKSLPRQAEG